MTRTKRMPSAASVEGDVFRPWLLAATVALFVARPLLPSEGTSTRGDALVFMLLPLVLCAVWALRAVLRAGRARVGAIDLAVVALVAWHAVSAFQAVQTGAPRPAINGTWQWVALAAQFFLVRQLIGGAREVRAVAAMMIALAVCLSAFGFQQYFYSIPRDQARYAADPEGALREARVMAPPGSRQRALFENRVNSSEPMATFALANSLAGFLVPWLTISVGICAAATACRTGAPRVWLPAAGCALLITACLILTKSRAAYLACAAASAALGTWTILQGSRIAARWLIVPVLLVALLLAAALGVGAIDREVFSEAGKSLGYRWQYWQATCHMIQHHPWFGCGPGNFQGYYTLYKLPEASETVADPHNFVLEVAATAGLPAALALFVVIGLVLWRGCRVGSDFAPAEPIATAAEIPLAADATLQIYLGGAAGFLFALVISPLAIVGLGLGACAAGLLIGSLCVLVLDRWVRRAALPVVVLVIAVAALLLNLLAGGGLNYAGVVGSWWLLAGLTLATTDRERRLPTGAAIAALALFATLSGLFFLTVYQPVLACNAALEQAEVEPQQAEKHLRAAALGDPLSAEPLSRLAMLEWMHWQQHPSEATFGRFVSFIDEALARDPHAAPLAELKGDICFEVHRRAQYPAALQFSVSAFEQATALDPTNSLDWAKLAQALSVAGQASEARAAAGEALRLDGQTPHADQKLPADMVERLQALD